MTLWMGFGIGMHIYICMYCPMVEGDMTSLYCTVHTNVLVIARNEWTKTANLLNTYWTRGVPSTSLPLLAE